MVKTDLNRDVVYKPKKQNEGFSLFLISKDRQTIIHDGGYNKHFDFFVETIEGERLNGYERVNFVYNGESLLDKMCSFRSSRAVFVDSQNRLFVKDVEEL